MMELCTMLSTTAARAAKSSTTALAPRGAIPLRPRTPTATLKECYEWGGDVRGQRSDLILDSVGFDSALCFPFVFIDQLASCYVDQGTFPKTPCFGVEI